MLLEYLLSFQSRVRVRSRLAGVRLQRQLLFLFLLQQYI